MLRNNFKKWGPHAGAMMPLGYTGFSLTKDLKHDRRRTRPEDRGHDEDRGRDDSGYDTRHPDQRNKDNYGSSFNDARDYRQDTNRHPMRDSRTNNDFRLPQGVVIPDRGLGEQMQPISKEGEKFANHDSRDGRYENNGRKRRRSIGDKQHVKEQPMHYARDDRSNRDMNHEDNRPPVRRNEVNSSSAHPSRNQVRRNGDINMDSNQQSRNHDGRHGDPSFDAACGRRNVDTQLHPVQHHMTNQNRRYTGNTGNAANNPTQGRKRNVPYAKLEESSKFQKKNLKPENEKAEKEKEIQKGKQKEKEKGKQKEIPTIVKGKVREIPDIVDFNKNSDVPSADKPDIVDFNKNADLSSTDQADGIIDLTCDGSAPDAPSDGIIDLTGEESDLEEKTLDNKVTFPEGGKCLSTGKRKSDAKAVESNLGNDSLFSLGVDPDEAMYTVDEYSECSEFALLGLLPQAPDAGKKDVAGGTSLLELTDKNELVYSTYSGAYKAKKKEDEKKKKEDEEKEKSKEILKNMEKTKIKADSKGRSSEKDQPVASTSKETVEKVPPKNIPVQKKNQIKKQEATMTAKKWRNRKYQGKQYNKSTWVQR